MADILTGLVKGLSGFMPQDNPDVKIFNAQTEMKEIAEKIEKVYARLGKQVYEAGGSEAYPQIKAELDMLSANRNAAAERLQAAKDEKSVKERAEADERVRREAEEAAYRCPNCDARYPEGSKFCQECGSKLEPCQVADKKFCPTCGNVIAEGHRFCQGCGTKIS